MQIKISMSYNFTPISLAITEKTENKYWQAYGEIGALVHCWWNVKPSVCCGKKYVDSSKD